MALDSAKKQAIISKFARQEKDTGSSEIQKKLLEKLWKIIKLWI